MNYVSETPLPTGQRLRLRKFAINDFAAVHEYATDPQVYRYAEWGPNTEDETRAFIDDAMQRKEDFLSYAVVLDDQLIGAAAVWVTEPGVPSGELGYGLNSRFWGHGYATIIAGMLVELGFKRLGIHRLTATCAPLNLASRRVLEKNGFVLEGQLRENKMVRGEFRDSLLFSRLSTDG
ncbi:GNAT family N-acetyltransferase [Glutamicibacter sp.]|uniref:GNAT family N-acetyltransferase n=1 Tax=Glutamicibacter sp. TaxID=1931995 RepID=UPI0028BE124A|nr:GNAT family N-acetyltransferase [Glutamicibacter sp.]